MAEPLTAQIVDLNEPREIAVPLDGDVIAADVMQQIATARRFPRSVSRFRKSVLDQVTLSQEIAAQCSYSLPRDGKVIEGPSVRFAEVVAAAWGNIRVGARVVEERDRFIIAEGLAWDLETNSAIAMQSQRRITNKDGRRYSDDMVAVTGNAAASIALRNAVLRAVPKALWNDLWLNAKAVALGDVKTLAQRRNNALEAFKPFGVTEAQICAALEIEGLRDIGLEQLATLQGFLTSITTEGVDPEEIFPPAETKATRPAPPPADGSKPAQSSPAPAAKAGAAPAASAKPPAAGTAQPAAGAPSQFELDVETALEGMIADAQGRGDLEALGAFFAEDLAKCSPAWRTKIEARIAQAVAEGG